ncbi:MAG TPA: hypothetical protein DEG55_04295 [Acidaminococcaceae bacterium]|nr:DUF2156 domain-containing protein [Acidaminococcaceae bacterium]HBX75342.1 hypothetical protein [Acidaminococcaceae bacterium]
MSKPEHFGSECAFTNLYIWRDYYRTWWTEKFGFLLIKVQLEDEVFYLQPFGGNDADLALLAREIKEAEGGPFEFRGIYECSLERLSCLKGEEEYRESRDSWDYVYLQEDLATLRGRRYHGQKNHYNTFKRENPDYVFEMINPENFAECLYFGEEWCKARMDTDPSIVWEIRALQEAFVNFEALGLRGGAIRINGKIQAFGFGKAINGQVCDENVEKANSDIRGLYAAIQTECAQKVWPDMKYINREEDMGHEGLRKAKEALHPAFMVKKYSLLVK